MRNNFDDDDYLIVALAISIGYADVSETREKYLAQLVLPFVERIRNYMQNPDCNKVTQKEFGFMIFTPFRTIKLFTMLKTTSER